MKQILIILFFLSACSFIQARSFSYQLYIYELNGETKVDINSSLPVTKEEKLSVAEAIAFLKAVPQAGSTTQIAILVDFGADGRKVLDHVNSSATMMLRFYEGFGSGAMKKELYKHRKNKRAEQDGADQPATAQDSKPKGDSKPQQKSEGRSQ